MRGAGGVEATQSQDSEEDEAWKLELRELGHSEAAIAEAFAARATTPGDSPPKCAPLEIWPDNWPVVEAFVALETQWRYHPTLGTHAGLIWSSVDWLVRDLRIKPKRQARADLRLMEMAALDEMRKQERAARVKAAGKAQES